MLSSVDTVEKSKFAVERILSRDAPNIGSPLSLQLKMFKLLIDATSALSSFRS